MLQTGEYWYRTYDGSWLSEKYALKQLVEESEK